MTDINTDGYRPDTYDVNVGGPVNLPKPRILDAAWTDDYGREYHVVGRERLTAAEDEIARLTIDLAETERERQKAVEREAKTAEQVERYRNGLPDGWFQTMTYEFAIGRGFPTNVSDRAEHRGRDGSLWRYDEFSDWWELCEYAPDVADLIAERDAAVARAAKAEINRLSPSPKSTQSGAAPAVTQLPTPDCDNPAHCRFVADMAVALGGDPDLGDGVNADNVAFWRARADHLEAEQQDDAAEVLVEKAARVIAVDSPPDALDYDTARRLHAAGLLRGGDEQ